MNPAHILIVSEGLYTDGLVSVDTRLCPIEEAKQIAEHLNVNVAHRNGRNWFSPKDPA